MIGLRVLLMKGIRCGQPGNAVLVGKNHKRKEGKGEAGQKAFPQTRRNCKISGSLRKTGTEPSDAVDQVQKEQQVKQHTHDI